MPEVPQARPARPYHHGNLKQVLLDSAEQILREQGIGGLKLRAIAKHAGVSHTAADPHFGDLGGLLSELAASGFERLAAAMATGSGSGPHARDIARGYVGFAVDNPSLFLLMFRSDAIDRTRPRLQRAARDAYAALAAAMGASGKDAAIEQTLSLAAAGRLAAAWALVHGLALLRIDRRLDPILQRIEPPPEADALIDAALASLSYS